jgi:MerR family transcriptional regulator, thiopeptide resistance regulator
VRRYRIQEFARLAGVTVRALHHYDQLGLLKPRRTAARYRLYNDGDLERLEQIVALQFLGVPLKQIGQLLVGRQGALTEALERQRRALEEKRRLLDRAIHAIRRAEQNPEPEALKLIIEVIAMQHETDWMKKYSTDEAWAKIQQRGEQWSPELQERVSRKWTDLIRDVEAALGEEPASERAQALAARWKELVEQFTGADPDITASVRNLYADRPNWPAEFREQMAPFHNPRVWEFVHRALEWRRTSS